MKINEQMKTFANEMIALHGKGYPFHRQEIQEFLAQHFGTKPDSVIPSDYCYNRVNKDSKPLLLFLFCEDGIYQCVGENFQYKKYVTAKPHGAKNEIIVGEWKDGRLIPNENWDLCGLKKSFLIKVNK